MEKEMLITHENELVKENKKLNIKPFINMAITIFIIWFLFAGLKVYIKYEREKCINNIFVSSCYTNKADVLNAIKLTQNLPNKITDKLIQNNVKIVYIPWQPTENADGMFNGLDKLISVNYVNSANDNIFTKYQNELVTLHEVAYAVDYDFTFKKYGYSYSGTVEFDNIFKKEAPVIFKQSNFNYYTKDFGEFYIKHREEYFVECFAFYYASDETNKFLLEQAPKTYDYIKKVSLPTDKYTFIKFLEEKN